MLDAIVFSSLWVSLAAAGLTAACSLAMGVPISTAAVALAFSGTLVVYNVDRLRDLDRDRITSPLRSRFVDRHGAGLALLVVAAGGASSVSAIAAGARSGLVLVPILALGLLHRRIKHLTFAKSAYIAGAWVAVVVGVPAAIDLDTAHVGWTAVVVGLAIAANAIASNVRDKEVAAALFGARAALRVARGVAVAGLAAGLSAPEEVRSLAAVPLLTLCALMWFRPSERYGLVVVDGALLAGALLSISFTAFTAFTVR